MKEAATNVSLDQLAQNRQRLVAGRVRDGKFTKRVEGISATRGKLIRSLRSNPPLDETLAITDKVTAETERLNRAARAVETGRSRREAKLAEVDAEIIRQPGEFKRLAAERRAQLDKLQGRIAGGRSPVGLGHFTALRRGVERIEGLPHDVPGLQDALNAGVKEERRTGFFDWMQSRRAEVAASTKESAGTAPVPAPEGAGMSPAKSPELNNRQRELLGFLSRDRYRTAGELAGELGVAGVTVTRDIVAIRKVEPTSIAAVRGKGYRLETQEPVESPVEKSKEGGRRRLSDSVAPERLTPVTLLLSGDATSETLISALGPKHQEGQEPRPLNSEEAHAELAFLVRGLRSRRHYGRFTDGERDVLAKVDAFTEQHNGDKTAVYGLVREKLGISPPETSDAKDDGTSANLTPSPGGGLQPGEVVRFWERPPRPQVDTSGYRRIKLPDAGPSRRERSDPINTPVRDQQLRALTLLLSDGATKEGVIGALESTRGERPYTSPQARVSLTKAVDRLWDRVTHGKASKSELEVYDALRIFRDAHGQDHSQIGSRIGEVLGFEITDSSASSAKRGVDLVPGRPVEVARAEIGETRRADAGVVKEKAPARAIEEITLIRGREANVGQSVTLTAQAAPFEPRGTDHRAGKEEGKGRGRGQEMRDAMIHELSKVLQVPHLSKGASAAAIVREYPELRGFPERQLRKTFPDDVGRAAAYTPDIIAAALHLADLQGQRRQIARGYRNRVERVARQELGKILRKQEEQPRRRNGGNGK